ncbi:hypothetical protein [Pseudomonas sp. ES3]|uniref:DUF4376 domain-containing protein n=1 Tax=Pseudomonas sp. ES3 TaxID=3424776 RepID=UPI003D3481DC
MLLYLVDEFGVLDGPFEPPAIPGFGVQIPDNALQFGEVLPPAEAGHVWAWVNNAPLQLADHRGPAYRTDTGERVDYDQLGELPAELTALAMPGAGYEWKDGGWLKCAALIHGEQTGLINLACQAQILGGFSSDALGALHQYSSQMDDQLNLTGVILRGLDSPYACRDEAGTKEFRGHTFAQLRQVGDDFTVFKLTLLQKANQLKQQLDQALIDGDVAALEAVTWEELPS